MRLLPATWSLLLAALLALFPAGSKAAPPSDCDSPRHAAESLFGWMHPDNRRDDLAIRCMEGTGRSNAELQLLARRLVEIFDGREIEPQLERLSEQHDYVNRATGRARAVIDKSLPSLYVEKAEDGSWRWPLAVLDVVDALHRETFAARSSGLVARLPSSLRGTVFGVELWQYLALLLLLLVGILLRKVIQIVVDARVKRLVDRYGQKWTARLVAALDSPGATLLMAGVIGVAYQQLHLPVKAALVMGVAVRVVAVTALVWAAYRLVDVISEAMAHKASLTESKLDDQLVPLARRSMKVGTVVLGFLFVLQNLDVDVGSLLAGLGIGGLAFALAAKDTLANFFGSVMIFADRPFQIGDWVVLEGGTEGTVEEVGFRSTRVRTFYDSLVTVPNSKIADARVDNYGARNYRRTRFFLQLTYDTPPELMQAFVEGVRAILAANGSTRKDNYEVHFAQFSAYSLDVLVQFFLKVPGFSDELRERSNIYLEILRLARTLGVAFAMPTRMHHEYVAQPGAERSGPNAPAAAELAEVVKAFGPGGVRSRPAGNEIAGGWYAAEVAKAMAAQVEAERIAAAAAAAAAAAEAAAGTDAVDDGEEPLRVRSA